MIIFFLSCLTIGMFLIGYSIGRLEERYVNSSESVIDSDINDLYDALMEVDEQRNSLSRDSVVGDR